MDLKILTLIAMILELGYSASPLWKKKEKQMEKLRQIISESNEVKAFNEAVRILREKARTGNMDEEMLSMPPLKSDKDFMSKKFSGTKNANMGKSKSLDKDRSSNFNVKKQKKTKTEDIRISTLADIFSNALSTAFEQTPFPSSTFEESSEDEETITNDLKEVLNIWRVILECIGKIFEEKPKVECNCSGTEQKDVSLKTKSSGPKTDLDAFNQDKENRTEQNTENSDIGVFQL